MAAKEVARSTRVPIIASNVHARVSRVTWSGRTTVCRPTLSRRSSRCSSSQGRPSAAQFGVAFEGWADEPSSLVKVLKFQHNGALYRVDFRCCESDVRVLDTTPRWDGAEGLYNA